MLTEHLYRSAIELNPSGIAIVSAQDHKALLLNSAMSKILGHPLPPSLDQQFFKKDETTWAFFDPAGKPVAWEASPLSLALQGIQVLAQELQVRRSDGTWGWILADSIPLTDPHSGHLVAGMVVMTDVTPMKAAEEALEQEEEKYRLLFENLTIGFALLEGVPGLGSPDFRFLEVNPAWQHITGLAPGEILHRRVKEIFPLVESPWLEVFSQVASTGQGLAYENYDTRRDRYFSTRVFSPKPGRLAMLINDISQRKKAEETLRDREMLLRLTFDGVHDGVLVLAAGSFKILEANRRAAELFDYPLETLKTLQLGDLSSACPQDTEDLLQKFQEDLHTGPVVVEWQAQTRTGQGFLAEISLSPAGAGLEERIFATIRDITQRKESQAQAEKTQRIEALGILAGGIAHEFNNLLGGIFGNIQLAQTLVGPDHRALPYLDQAFSVMGRARTLTNQLLTFAQTETLNRQTLRLPAYLEEACARTFEGTQVTWSLDSSESPWAVSLDPDQFLTVLEKIFSNVLLAMPEGGPLQISFRNLPLDHPGNPIKASPALGICFRDEGPGIPRENLSKVFDPFFTTREAASGLGLALAYSIIKRHQGHMEARIPPQGSGAEIWIFLPAHRG